MHKLRFSTIGGLEPCVHAARLKIAGGGNRADLAIGVLTGQPRLDVKGPPRAKPHVPGAQNDCSVRDFKRFQDRLGTAQHPLLFRVAVVGMRDRNHLDLFELVLAQHAGGVAPGRSGLRAETQRMRRHPDGQRMRLQNIARHRICQRHLRGRHQPHPFVGLVTVFAKFGQLVGAIHGRIAHQHGRIYLRQAVLIHMGVDHELRQRPVNARNSAPEHHKAAARNLGGRFKIHRRRDSADLVMFHRRKVKAAGAAPAVLFDVVVLVRAVGHIIGGQVGDMAQRVGQLRVERPGRILQRGNLGLFFRHKRAQALEFILIAPGLGRTHLF